MTAATIRREKYIQSDRVLYVALELSNRTWKLGMSVGFGQKARERNVPAGDLVRFSEEIHQAKKRFGLPKAAPVYSCYEAGRDGFWLHRFLEAEGLENVVVDPSSIEVSRRKRRAKTDHLDVHGLLKLLMRYWLGEPKVLSVVRVPSVEAEDNRHLHRELQQLKRERTQHINRIKGLLVGVGVRLHLRRRGVLAELEQARLWDGARLPPALHCRLVREQERLELVQRQIHELEAERKESLRECRSEEVEKVRRLMALRGIGANGAWLLGMELFVWRQFQNRRQVGSLAGLTPTPHESGAMKREQGISKAGNRYIRAMMVELAWGWLRFQPESRLSQWYQERFGRGGPRLRRIGIVALARKLLVAVALGGSFRVADGCKTALCLIRESER
jgi:transposase